MSCRGYKSKPAMFTARGDMTPYTLSLGYTQQVSEGRFKAVLSRVHDAYLVYLWDETYNTNTLVIATNKITDARRQLHGWKSFAVDQMLRGSIPAN